MAEQPLSTLLVRVAADVSSFTRGMSTADKAANKARTQITRLTTLTVAGMAVAGAAALRFGAELNEIGQDVLETRSKFNEITGASQDMANAYVDSMAVISGSTKSELQGIIANLGNVAQGAGFAGDEAINLATDMTSLAADLASFNNLQGGTEAAAKILTSALVGEREALKQLGIVLTQADVNQQALAMTGKALTKELTQQDKILATSALLWERSGAAVGDMARTSDSAARQSQQLGAALGQIKENLGVIVSESVGGAFTTFLAGIATHAATATGAVGTLIEQYGFMNALSALIAGGSTANAAAILANNAAVRESTVDYDALAAAQFRELEALQFLAAGLDGLAAPTRTLAGSFDRLAGGEKEAVEWSHNLGESLVGMSIDVGDIVVPAVTALHSGLEVTGDVADKTAVKLDTVANAATGMLGVFRSGGSFLSKLGGLLGVVSPFLGPLGVFTGLAGGVLSGFATGGQVGPGGMAVVGEQGPELIQAGRAGATVTPNGRGGTGGGGGDINISLVMESGRQLVDTITVKQDRDKDVRRIIRVPVAAMAVS